MYLQFFDAPFEFDCPLENICLAQLHKYVDHREVGNHKIFGHLIKELQKIIYNGVQIKRTVGPNIASKRKAN